MNKDDVYLDSRLDGTRVLNISGTWDSEVAEFIENNSFDVLQIYRGSIDDFEKLAPFAQKIRWLHSPSVDSSRGLEKLQFLERLSQLGSLPEPPFDYRLLLKLRHFTCDVAALVPPDYLNHPSIEVLDLEGVKAKSLDFLSSARKLRALRLVGGAIKSLNGAEKLTDLRELRLLHTKGLGDISGLFGVGSLEILELDGTPKVADISPVYGLSRLRWLFINARNAKQRDLAWLSQMPSLECAGIWVETETIDWNIFAKHPRLYDVVFYATRGFTSGTDDEIIKSLAASGKRVRKLTRFPKALFPAFRIEFEPASDIKNPKQLQFFQNHLRSQ